MPPPGRAVPSRTLAPMTPLSPLPLESTMVVDPAASLICHTATGRSMAALAAPASASTPARAAVTVSILRRKFQPPERRWVAPRRRPGPVDSPINPRWGTDAVAGFRYGTSRTAGALDLQPGVLQVELALDPVHDVVADRPLVAEPDDGLALGLQQLADQALVGQGAVLGAVVLPDAGARLEAPAAELEQAVQPGHGVVAGPVLAGQLVQALQGGFGGGHAGPQLLLLLGPVGGDPQPPDQAGQGQPLEDQGGQNHREGQEQDQVAHGEVLGQGQGRG